MVAVRASTLIIELWLLETRAIKLTLGITYHLFQRMKTAPETVLKYSAHTHRNEDVDNSVERIFEQLCN